jgi:hypothetical protein
MSALSCGATGEISVGTMRRMDVERLAWGPLSYTVTSIVCLRLGDVELARVADRGPAGGFTATVAMHRRDYRRRRTRVFDTRQEATQAAEAWTRASWDRILAELPSFTSDGCSAGKLVYPASNPETPLAAPLDAVEATERRVKRSGPLADNELTARRRR